jgi:hypothetical protein
MNKSQYEQQLEARRQAVNTTPNSGYAAKLPVIRDGYNVTPDIGEIHVLDNAHRIYQPSLKQMKKEEKRKSFLE